MLAADLLVSELYYAPTEPTATELAAIPDLNTNGKDFQFIEIYNAGSDTVALNGYQFTKGIEYTFPQANIASGEYVVVAKSVSAFRLRFGDAPRVLGEFVSGSLNDDGERVKLVDNLEEELVDFEYSATRPWPNSPDGNGASLELMDPQQTAASDLDEYFVWRGSTEFGGSPGVAGVGELGVVINEVLTHTDAPVTLPDSIELFNRTDEAVEIGGWYLSDSFSSPLKFQIPAGTVIPPGDYITYTENDFDPTPENPDDEIHFRLSGAKGDEVVLTLPDGTGGVKYFVDNVEFGGSANGESFGRLPNGTGELGVLSHNSFGCDNTSARVGPVIVSEIVYNIPISDAVLGLQPEWGKSDVEFVEIHNPTNQDVVLTNWRLRGDVDFDFPADDILASGETLLITSITPTNPTVLTAFRAQYGLAADTRIMGPWSGSLGNSGGRVELQYPDEPPMEEPDFYPRLIEDLTIYDDRAPWPVAADGDGMSLQRVAPYLFGNYASAWRAADPSPGVVSFQSGVNGDFDADGQITSVDIDILRDFQSSGVQVAEYDVDGNIVVNEDDVNHLIFDIAETQYGDANLDGVVDAVDLVEWQRLHGRPCGNWASGDFNGDQFIDDSDLALWSLHKFTGTPRASRPAPRTPRAAAFGVNENVTAAWSATDAATLSPERGLSIAEGSTPNRIARHQAEAGGAEFSPTRARSVDVTSVGTDSVDETPFFQQVRPHFRRAARLACEPKLASSLRFRSVDALFARIGPVAEIGDLPGLGGLDE